MTVRCPMSDLPVDQCALPCHGNVGLPDGVAPSVVRGVEPSGWSTMLTLPAREQHDARDTRKRTRRPKPLVKCRWSDQLEQWVTPEHLRDCKSNTCRGCKPCGEDHCDIRLCPNHVDHDSGVWTCAPCIGECRDTIAEVETLATLVWEELEFAGIESEVVNLAGPVADPRAWSELRARDSFRGWCDLPRPDWWITDRQHPLAVFRRWEIRLRTAYEQAPAQPRSSLSQCADYFRRMLGEGLAHTDVFVAFFSDLRKLRSHLEEVLADSRRPETGAPCPTCAREKPGEKAPRLEKRTAHWCDNPTCQKEHVDTIVTRDGEILPDTTRDRWVCPVDSRHTWKHAEYQQWVNVDYLAHATRLTASQMRQQWSINPSTLRTWADRGEVRKRGTDSRGRVLYDVGDARACAKKQTLQLTPAPIRDTTQEEEPAP